MVFHVDVFDIVWRYHFATSAPFNPEIIKDGSSPGILPDCRWIASLLSHLKPPASELNSTIPA
jgi:hypothetical protein